MGNCIRISNSPVPSIVNEIQEIKNNVEKKEVEDDIFKDVRYDNTVELSFNGLRKRVKVLRVIDGDTVDIAMEHDTKKIYRHRVRLFGIDTPEKRPPKDDPDREKEIEASLRAKNALELRLKDTNYIVTALFDKPDKYGRLLCTFYDNLGNDINQWMIQSGHAYAYYGKKKKKFNSDSNVIMLI